jgi:molybdopterin molybdotransferase
MENSEHHDRTADRLVSLDEARACVERIQPLEAERIAVDACVGRITAVPVQAISACPSADSSLKDGFAVVASDIAGATDENPVRLRVTGTLTAGGSGKGPEVYPGTCVRIMTGAVVPPGADAVLSSEFAAEEGDGILACRDARPGRNILRRGRDVERDSVVVAADTLLRPAHAGLLAAAGVSGVDVYRLPRVVIVATGSELVVPGNPIGPGQVAASNLVTLQAALLEGGIGAETVIIHDDLQHLRRRMEPLLESCDVLLTCGGVLDGDKDLTMQAMDELGVKPVFRRVRVGPGKGICFGRRGRSLVFNLPGGPPSNHVGFLLLALPGIRRLCGHTGGFELRNTAELTRPLEGQDGWTEIYYATLMRDGERLKATPVKMRSRLMGMAAADCLIELSENRRRAAAGESVTIWKIR